MNLRLLLHTGHSQVAITLFSKNFLLFARRKGKRLRVYTLHNSKKAVTAD